MSNESLQQSMPGTRSTIAPETELDASRQRQAKEYARLKRYLFLIELAVGAMYGLAVIFSDFSPWLRNQVEQLSSLPAVQIAAYLIVFSAIYSVIILPLNYLGGYVWPHRYGLSRQTIRAWAWDHVKALALGVLFGLIFVETLYWLMHLSPSLWWLWAGLFYLLFTVILSNLTPLIIIPLFFKLRPLTDTELVERLMHLAHRAGTQVRGVYTMDMSTKTNQANAALVGLGNTRRIVLSDTMLQNYTSDEIETVLAHELGHHAHGDIGKGIAFEAFLTLGGLWLSSLALATLIQTLGYHGIADIAGMPVLVLLLGFFGLVTLPLTNAYSRWREALADRYALEVTQKPQAFISAMVRLANQNLAEAAPERWMEIVFHSHPAIARRIAMAQTFKLAGNRERT